MSNVEPPNIPSEGSLSAGGLGGGFLSAVGGMFGGGSESRERADAVLINKQIRQGNKDFVSELSGLTKAIKKASKQIESLSFSGSRGGGGGAGAPQNPSTSTANAVGVAIASGQSTANAAKPPASAQALGGGGGTFANFRGGFAGVADSAIQMGSQVMGALDRRIDNSYSRMLQTDRLGVLMQQTQGITQQQYYNQMRLPLQGYRLGQGGITELLALQASTGINAARQAGSIQGMRAATGYSYSTQDFAQMLRTLASPQVSNRMTVTMGLGFYGPGGRERSMMDMMQGIVSRTGLSNERILRGAMQPGSMTRARLTAMGIPEDMHDMILQYAQTNQQFQKKTGGKLGMYNPESANQRRIMGIEGNFATEREETTRLGEAREEKFYNRQKDNMASLERNTQAMIELTTAIEEMLSGAIGARISTRGNPLTRLARGIAGVGLMGLGAAYTIKTGGIGGALGGGALVSTGLGMVTGSFQGGPTGPLGDPTEHVNKKKSASNANRKQTSAPSGLHATFRERLEAMMSDNPNVKVGGGFRSSAQQETLFKSRYSRTSEKTGVFWDGSYWKKNAGVADVAPPGMSMHEIGLAADLTGDLDWVQKNAHKYGLKTFADVNDEPWHVQPAELPNSRRQYEKEGAIWGTIPGAARFDANSFFEGETSEGGVSDALYKSTGSTTVPSFSQMSIADQMAAQRAMNVLGVGGGNVLQTLGSSSSGGGSSGKGGSTKGRGRNPLQGDQVAKALFDAGFRGEDLVKALAISHRESGGWNSNALNPNSKTGDLSYGLFQINMIGDLGPYRRQLFGIDENEDLYDPVTNAKAAFKLYQYRKKEGKDPFYDWGGYKGKEATFKTNMKMARNVAETSGYLHKQGDPTMPTRGGGGTTVIEGGGVTIAPNIYIQTTGNSTADAHRAALEVSKLITHDIKMNVLRGM